MFGGIEKKAYLCGEPKFKNMEVKKFFEKYEIAVCSDFFEDCGKCMLNGKRDPDECCGMYFVGCPLPQKCYFKIRKTWNK